MDTKHTQNGNGAGGMGSVPVRQYYGSPITSTKPCIAVCTPGASFDTAWLAAWNILYPHLLNKYRVICATLKCSNQYTVRDVCAHNIQATMRDAQLAPEFTLWLDSDNLLTPDGFDMLRDALVAIPQADAVGGWYYIDVEPPAVCAAYADDSVEGGSRQVTLADIQCTYDRHELLEVTSHMGFGALLMRTSLLMDAGPHPFRPTVNADGSYLGDDVSFCRRAIAQGRKFFIHPDVFLPHLKIKEVPGAVVKRATHASTGIEGWMSERELSWLMETACDMDSIVEIGCYKGRSTSALLTACPGPVHAVDHWRGSPMDSSGTPVDGGEGVYETFTANVGHYPNLHVMKMPSMEAVRLFDDASVDMVFVDGAHDYDNVVADLRAWLPKARKILCGHDWNWPGVERAVREVLGSDVQHAQGSIWFKVLDAVPAGVRVDVEQPQFQTT